MPTSPTPRGLRKRPLGLLALLIISILGAWFALRPPPSHALSVNYLNAVDGHGHWKLRFGITNVGAGTVFTIGRGYLEISGQTNPIPVAARAPAKKLPAGHGHVVEVILSEQQMASLGEKWRYTCQYADASFRSRLYQWQWSTNGPGVRINWLVPHKLKGMRLSVKGRSDWISLEGLGP